MKRWLLIALCLPCIVAAQTTSHTQDSLTFRHQLELIGKLRDFARDSMKLHIRDDFYRNWQEPDTMIAYVYVSRRDSVKSPTGQAFVYCGTNYDCASTTIRQYESQGYATMLYRAAGTSGAMLNKRLLQYTDESIAFIVFHEAMHQHIRESRIQAIYPYEEALCDVVGNLSAVRFFTGVQKAKAVAHMRLQEQLFATINECTQKIDTVKCARRIKQYLKHATLFHRDRFDYPVNNAYLLRYTYYAKMYADAKKAYEADGQDIGKLTKSLNTVR